MAADTRERMVEGAARLLAEHGTQGTSFADVIAHTGAPRGSIYHHFPEGKDQLIGEAVDLAGRRAIELLQTKAGRPAREVTAFFLEMWRQTLLRSGFTVGCSVVGVTVTAESEDLLQRAGTVFRDWSATLADLLDEGGMNRNDAGAFATLLIASSEGAVVMSRASHSMEPFETVAEQLLSWPALP
jgi:AcrR family transcriptional regulator